MDIIMSDIKQTEPKKEEKKDEFKSAYLVPILPSGMPTLPMKWESDLIDNKAHLAAMGTHLLESELQQLSMGEKESICWQKIEAGRELGLPIMASLNGFKYQNGKITLTTEMKWGIVQKYVLTAKQKGLEEIDIVFVQNDAEACIIKLYRPKIFGKDPQMYKWTFKQAHDAGLDKNAKGNKNPWLMTPIDMCAWRAKGQLCRHGFADLFAGNSYSQEEVADFTEEDLPMPNPRFAGAVSVPFRDIPKDEAKTPPVMVDDSEETEVVTQNIKTDEKQTIKQDLKTVTEQYFDDSEEPQYVQETKPAPAPVPSKPAEPIKTISPPKTTTPKSFVPPTSVYDDDEPAVVTPAIPAKPAAPAPVVAETKPDPAKRMDKKKSTTKVKASMDLNKKVEEAKADPANQIAIPQTVTAPQDNYFASLQYADGDIPSEMLREILARAKIDYIAKIVPHRSEIRGQFPAISNAELVWKCIDQLHLPETDLKGIETEWREAMANVLNQIKDVIGTETNGSAVKQLLLKKGGVWTEVHVGWAMHYLQTRQIVK